MFTDDITFSVENFKGSHIKKNTESNKFIKLARYQINI